MSVPACFGWPWGRRSPPPASDHVGYILTKDEYHQSGYEVTASFYGDGLGQLMLDAVTSLVKDAAKAPR